MSYHIAYQLYLIVLHMPYIIPHIIYYVLCIIPYTIYHLLCQATNALDKPRTIAIPLCGVGVSMVVKDPGTEWDLRLHSLIKADALGKVNGLVPLMHESWLMTFGSGECSVPKAMYCIKVW